LPAEAGTHNAGSSEDDILNPRVMAGLVPAIHVVPRSEKGVDARDKPGHEGGESLT